MSEREPSFEPESQRKLTGRELVIAAMGIIAFNFELGPNAHVPEVDETRPELADELPTPPTEYIPLSRCS